MQLISSQVAKLTEAIQGSTHTNDDELAAEFPSFLWLVRDFALELTDGVWPIDPSIPGLPLLSAQPAPRVTATCFCCLVTAPRG